MDSYDLVVIGTGVAATKIAETCRKSGWQVAVVDRRPYGGTCMLRGCDPKKLLWGVAQTVDQARRFSGDGFEAKDISLSWPALMRFKRSFLQDAPRAVEQRFQHEGIATLHGRAHFVDPRKVAVDGRTVGARHIAIASGSKPTPLPFAGADLLLTSDDFLEMPELPRSLVFVGGGYVSFEFAHIAARAGAKVTILHEDARPLGHFDRELVNRLIDKSRRLGIDVQLSHRVIGITKAGQGVAVRTRANGSETTFEAAVGVHGAGRVPDIDDLDLGAGRLEREGPRLRLFQRSLQSCSNPAVYAAGDAAAVGPMLTPVSEIDAEIVSEHLLQGGSRHAPDYTGVPSVVFTIPPLASVGLSEEAAKARNFRFRVVQGDNSSWYSARRVKEDTSGFKILIEERTSRILGAHLIGPNVEEAINLFALAVRLKVTAKSLKQLVPAYPSEGSDIGYMLG